jgi:hypothetical protein
MKNSESKDFFKKRATEKAESRKKDAEDLESGAKNREQLRRENGLGLDYSRIRIKFDKAKKLS